MFEHDTKEKRTGVVEITDFSFEVVQEMVRAMMEGACGLWYTQSEALATIADKYNIHSLIQAANQKKRVMNSIPWCSFRLVLSYVLPETRDQCSLS